MKTFVTAVGIISYLLLMGSTSNTYAETLKEYATVCRTKNQFNEIALNRDNQAYVMQMLIDGKCVVNLGGKEVPVEVLEGVFPLVKIKMIWNHEVFVGWTDTTFVGN